MKKYLLGVIAIVLAVSLSSFEKLNTIKNEDEQALYWYPVQANNAIDHTQLINSSPLTKTQMRDNSLIPCPEAAGVDCIRGFEDLQTSDVSSGELDFTQKAQ